jgi:hypothetical protein
VRGQFRGYRQEPGVAWRIVDAMLRADTPVHEYAPGT